MGAVGEVAYETVALNLGSIIGMLISAALIARQVLSLDVVDFCSICEGPWRHLMSRIRKSPVSWPPTSLFIPCILYKNKTTCNGLML